MNVNHELIKDLLHIKAVQINTENYFTWTSGIKSPIYCDNRLTMSYPAIRKKIAKLFVKMITTNGYEPDLIAGCATAGIPHAAWVADLMELPMVYVRSAPKSHGQGKQIEGQVQGGQKAIVIEDLISTGQSALNVVEALEQAGVEVIAVLAIFTYRLEQADKAFKQAEIPLFTLTHFDELIDWLYKSKDIDKQAKDELLAWRNQLS